MFSSNDDDDLFTPSASSNLANLFGAIVSSTTDLKYTAPKQPKNNSDVKEQSTAPQVSVVCAKVVLTKKLVDSTYQDLGKYGFAIVGNHDFVKEMLLYKDKQHVIAKVTVNDSFNLIHVDTDTLRFNDDLGGQWETKFVKSDDFFEFVKVLKSRNVAVVDKLPKQEVIKELLPKKEITEVSDLPKDEHFNDNQVRVDILTRMAKMGQSVLPGKLVKTSTGSDSETDENIGSKKKPVVKKKPNHSSNVSLHSETSDINQPVLYQMQPYAFQQPYLPQSVNVPYPNQDFNYFISENRTHNSEIRINLTTISGKLDTILNEIYRIKTPTNTDKLENEFLKSKIIDLESKLNMSSNSSSDQTLKLKELEDLLDSKNKRINEIEQEIERLNLALNDANVARDNIEILKRENETLSTQVNDLNSKIETISAEDSSTKNSYMQLQELHDNISQENKRLLEENKELKDELQSKEAKTDQKINPNEIKDIMNAMFQNILEDFESTQSATIYKEIKTSLAKHLKTATFSIIDKIQKD